MKAFIFIALILTSVCSFGASTRDGYIIKNETIASSTLSITSEIISLDQNSKVGIHTRLGSAGAATGTVTTYLSNDMVNAGRSVSNWVSYDATNLTANGAIFKNFVDIGAKWLKVVYTKAGTATGTLSSVIYVQ